MTPIADPAGPEAPNGAGAEAGVSEGKASSESDEARVRRARHFESLGLLANGVAHDLNNVLTPILMATEVLLPKSQAADDRELLQLVASSARRGAELVQQLLVFAGGGEDTPRRDVSLADPIAGAERTMRHTFPRNLQVSVRIPPGLWWVRCDRAQIHRALVNLCDNARDAMPDGGRTEIAAENVEVDAALAGRQPCAKAGRHVRITVTDTGGGIPADVAERIFDPFFTTRSGGGHTGVGLATVWGIVRSHGGFIEVRSAEGAGSRFEVYLPSAGFAPPQDTPDNPRQPLDGNDEVLLIIDDEKTVRDSLREILCRRHYRIVTAGGGQEGYDMLARGDPPIDIVMTDMLMPVMDGPAFIARARRLKPYLPIIAISGIQEFRRKLEIYVDPPVLFLSKPFKMDVLLGALRRALDGEPAAKG